MYEWLKWFHVLGMVIYVGGFLSLTRLMGHAVRYESADARRAAYGVYKRMHKFVDWGGLGIMLVAGLWLLVADPMGKAYMKQGYFHVKMTSMVALIVCDIVLTKRLFALDPDGAQPGPTPFRIIHGIAGLALMGALIAVYVVRA